MEVGKVSAYNVQSDRKVKTSGSGGDSTQNASSAKTDGAQQDRVEFSKGYAEMAEVRKTTVTEGDVRPDQVERFKTMIDNGEYTVEPDKVASKIIESGW